MAWRDAVLERSPRWREHLFLKLQHECDSPLIVVVGQFLRQRAAQKRSTPGNFRENPVLSALQPDRRTTKLRLDTNQLILFDF